MYNTEVSMRATRYQDSTYQYAQKFCNPATCFTPARTTWNVVQPTSMVDLHRFLVSLNRTALVLIYTDPELAQHVKDSIESTIPIQAKLSDLVLVDAALVPEAAQKYGVGLMRNNKGMVVRFYKGNFTCPSLKSFVLSSKNVRW